MIRGEERSKKPRVTLERKDNLKYNNRKDEGLYSWQSGKGRDTYLTGRDASRCDSDEISLFCENRLSHCELSFKYDSANHQLNIDGEERCRRVGLEQGELEADFSHLGNKSDVTFIWGPKITRQAAALRLRS
jgi:hypothetical protein